MAIITTYTNDTATTGDDRFLTSDASGATKLTTGAILKDYILAPGNVTPAMRSGGFKVGTIAAATFGTIGVKAITGVGFTPKLVRFTIMPSASTDQMASGSGAMDSAGIQFWVFTSIFGTNKARESGTTACIVIRSSGTNTALCTASYSSMDSDGFSVNVTTASATFDVAYEAYA